MLTLSVSVGEGFWLLREGSDDERWMVREVFLARGYVIEGPNGAVYEIKQEDEVEIAPAVWLGDGNRRIVGRARVLIDAPQNVTILRDELYEERKKKEAA
jgi:hypothetical protein